MKGCIIVTDPTKTYRVKNKLNKLNINENNNKIGYVNVSTFNAITFEPIENAKIEILELKISGLYHETGYGDIIVTEFSDSNGQVPLIELPSNYEEEEILTAEHEHIHYHISVSAEGYHFLFVTNILIYPGITNIYRINLSPSSLQRPQYEFIITPVIT